MTKRRYCTPEAKSKFERLDQSSIKDVTSNDGSSTKEATRFSPPRLFQMPPGFNPDAPPRDHREKAKALMSKPIKKDPKKVHRWKAYKANHLHLYRKKRAEPEILRAEPEILIDPRTDRAALKALIHKPT